MKRIALTFVLLFGISRAGSNHTTSLSGNQIKPTNLDRGWSRVFVTTYFANDRKTATGKLVASLRYRRSKSRFIALSRDFLAENGWKGSIHFGDSVEIRGVDKLDGTYIVQDAMAAYWPKKCRYKGPIRRGCDVLLGSDEHAIGGRWNNIMMRHLRSKKQLSGSRRITTLLK